MPPGVHTNLQLPGDLSPPLLHFDLLSYMMSLMESRRDLLPLMMTCRSLYSAGYPHFLRLAVVLSTLRRCQSFCAFMLMETDQAIRFQNFYRLEVKIDFDPALDEYGLPIEQDSTWSFRPIVDDLMKVLTHSCQLRYLYLNSCENILEAIPDSRTALLQLSALREFNTDEVGRLTIGLLMKMRVPLTSLDLGFSPNDDTLNPVLRAPFDFLQNFSTSLKKISFWATATNTGRIAVRCPSVHTLTIIASGRLDALFIEPLLLAFPNVTQFTFVWEDDRLHAGESFDLGREANRRALRRHQPLWSKLDSISGSLSALHHLGFLSPVRHLDIEEVHCPYEILGFHQLLEDIQPTCLDFDLNFDNWETAKLGEVLSTVFQHTPLSHLVIGLLMNGPYYSSKARVQELLQEFLTSIRGSSLRYLAVYISTLPRIMRPYPAKSGVPVSFGASSEALGSEFVGDVARAAPALSHLFLVYERCDPSFWSIRRDESGVVVLEPQPKEVGFRIMSRARERPPTSSSRGS